MHWIRFALATATLALLAACDDGGDSSPTPPPAATYDVATYLAPQDDASENNGYGIVPKFAQFTEQTVRQVAHFSIGGDSLKIQFTNEFGTAPVTLDKVHIARSLGSGTIDPDTDKPLTFSGGESVTIPAGQTVYSDTIAYPMDSLSDLSVSIYMKSAAVTGSRLLAATTAYVGAGDLTTSPGIPNASTATNVYFMNQVVVTRSTKVNVVVALGDSITEGGGTSTTDAYDDWPDQLSKFANANFDVSVVNAGIGGNRWVNNAFGPCGLCRMDRDVLNVPGVTHVFLALGVNDIGYGYYLGNLLKDPAQIVSADQIIANLQAAIDKAKAKGLKVFVATIGPYEGTGYYTTGQPDQIPVGSTTPYNGEAIREQVNAYIRTNTGIDGVLDVDKIMQDPNDPLHVNTAWSADGSLHPNDVGYAHIAKSIDLSQLQ